MCSVCEKFFTDSKLLKRHIRNRTREKPFMCILCEKSFNSLLQLREHSIVHTGEKPCVLIIASLVLLQGI
jgi:uncharacterized Zn-finger protein